MACERPSFLRYKVTDFTNPLVAALASDASGEWTFAPESAGTRVVWSYDYAARNVLTAAPLGLIVAFLWKPWMQVGSARVQALGRAGHRRRVKRRLPASKPRAR